MQAFIEVEYEANPSFRIRTQPDTTFGDILRSACEFLGLQPTLHYITDKDKCVMASTDLLQGATNCSIKRRNVTSDVTTLPTPHSTDFNAIGPVQDLQPPQQARNPVQRNNTPATTSALSSLQHFMASTATSRSHKRRSAPTSAASSTSGKRHCNLRRSSLPAAARTPRTTSMSFAIAYRHSVKCRGNYVISPMHVRDDMTEADIQTYLSSCHRDFTTAFNGKYIVPFPASDATHSVQFLLRQGRIPVV